MTGYIPELGRMLEFSSDDLDSNRALALSEMQLYHLRVRRQRSVLTGVGIVFALAFIAALCIYGGRTGSSILTLVGIGLTLCSAAITGVFARYWMRLNADIRTNRVDVVSGPLERVLKPINKQVVNYILRVDGASFTVSKDVFKLFEHGKTYTLYRTPYTATLLSAERA